MNKDCRPRDPRADREPRRIRWIDATQDDHPARLLGRSGVPSPLAVWGRLDRLDRTAVAVVGTRSASPYGLGVARRLAAALARRRVTVVSGGAHGIDQAAHRAALDAGGRTLAVLGEGLCAPRTMSDPMLLSQVAEAGAVLSEFDDEAPPRRWHFPRRNATLVALAERVVVVEAPARSGALITADLARRAGVPVHAVPGPIGQTGSAGPHRLLQAGARLLDDPEAFAGELATDGAAGDGAQEDPDGSLLHLLGSGPVTADELAAAAGISPAAVAVALLEFEVLGCVRRLPGGRYERYP